MGAPAISTAPRRARTTTKPRRAATAKPRPRAAAKPRPRTTAKPRPRAAAGPRPAATAKPRSGAAAKARPAPSRRAVKPRAASAGRSRGRAASGSRVAVAGAGNVVMLPVAAVGGIADSGLIERLTRGRSWIVLLGLLLGGIVAINVWGLGMSASSSSTEARIDSLQSDNGVLRARNAKLLSTEEIQQRAAALGLAIPAPDAIHYLDSNDGDAAKAAKRLAAGEIVVGDPAVQGGATDADGTVDPAAATTTGTTMPTDPATVTPPADPIIDPNTGLPAVDPATGAPITAVDPVTGEGIVAP